MHSIIVLGPDRVGKSTLIRNTAKSLTDAGYSVATLHFREVQPHHHSPIDQYYEALGGGVNPGVQYLLLDRFVPDTLFYEERRANFPPIDYGMARTVESILLQLTGNEGRVDVAHLAPNWNEQISKRHREEIRGRYPGCSEYWTSICLERARTEHYLHTDFVSAYCTDGESLISPDHYHPYSGMPGEKQNIFDVFESIPLADT